MVTRNIKENMIAEVSNELNEDDLEGRLWRNTTFSGGNRHMRDTISEVKIWTYPVILLWRSHQTRNLQYLL